MTTNYHGTETFESIRVWANTTFGVPTIDAVADRADEEMDELFGALHEGSYDKAVVEAADVVITLLNMPGIEEAIQSKMAINRARKWTLTGQGTGYHIKES